MEEGECPGACAADYEQEEEEEEELEEETLQPMLPNIGTPGPGTYDLPSCFRLGARSHTSSKHTVAAGCPSPWSYVTQQHSRQQGTTQQWAGAGQGQQQWGAHMPALAAVLLLPPWTGRQTMLPVLILS
jgi:hypothetical protein